LDAVPDLPTGAAGKGNSSTTSAVAFFFATRGFFGAAGSFGGRGITAKNVMMSTRREFDAPCSLIGYRDAQGVHQLPTRGRAGGDDLNQVEDPNVLRSQNDRRSRLRKGFFAKEIW
jgi:hypothetical protein